MEIAIVNVKIIVGIFGAGPSVVTATMHGNKRLVFAGFWVFFSPQK